MSLESLPLELVIAAILLPQSNHTLSQFSLVSCACLRLADDASLWRLRVARHFKFPAHLTSRVRDWRVLYASLCASKLWNCGSNTHGRLGIHPVGTPEELRRVIC